MRKTILGGLKNGDMTKCAAPFSCKLLPFCIYCDMYERSRTWIARAWCSFGLSDKNVRSCWYFYPGIITWKDYWEGWGFCAMAALNSIVQGQTEYFRMLEQKILALLWFQIHYSSVRNKLSLFSNCADSVQSRTAFKLIWFLGLKILHMPYWVIVNPINERTIIHLCNSINNSVLINNTVQLQY